MQKTVLIFIAGVLVGCGVMALVKMAAPTQAQTTDRTASTTTALAPPPFPVASAPTMGTVDQQNHPAPPAATFSSRPSAQAPAQHTVTGHLPTPGATAMSPAAPGGQTAMPGRPGGDRPRDARFTLMRTFHNIARLDEDGKAPLSSAQAKAILAVMTPLRSQATLTADEAAKAQTKLDAVLTTAQRDAIAAMPRFGGGGRGGQQGGGGRGGPGGAGNGGTTPTPGLFTPRSSQHGEQAPAGGEQPAPAGGRPPGQGRMFGGGMPANFNPFNPPKDSPMAERMNARLQTTFDALQAKAR